MTSQTGGNPAVTPFEISNGVLRVRIASGEEADRPAYHVAAVDLHTPQGWRCVLKGMGGAEFATAQGAIPATTCEVRRVPNGGWTATLSGKADGWEAREVLVLAPGASFLRREQMYRFTRPTKTAIHPGFTLPVPGNLRYTFALRAHERQPAGLQALRSAVDWALPFPFHVWHDGAVVALYGLDKRTSRGTLDFTPPGADGAARLRVYYPDDAGTQPGSPKFPDLATLDAGAEIVLAEIVAAKPLTADEEPLLEAERLAAEILLPDAPPAPDMAAVAARIQDFYGRCELWEPDALGPGRGWFTNMWVRTQTGPAKKRGEMSGYYDLGWGEGIAVEAMLGMIRHWRRTGDASLLVYVDTMTRSIALYKRGPGDDQPYYDRSDGKRFGDFLMDVLPGRRIWTHSLGHTGSQLLQLYQAAPDYPNAEARSAWLAAATSMARFLAGHQRPDGDLQDIFDDRDAEVNAKPHRITARAVVCGLWARLGQITGDRAWAERASRLAVAVAPEISRYEYYNQMLDGIYAPATEFVDGEAAYYALEGLVPLYAATREPAVLALCRKAAAFGIAWTYFYNVPNAHNGVARGGQCCRMDDFPLLYPIGPAKAMTPLLELHALTGDPLFEKMAEETAAFIANWQAHDPGKPWDGGMIHAQGQYCGKHWGPDLAGQVDTGMATGNGLAALEAWLRH